jgi:hypothetical protein
METSNQVAYMLGMFTSINPDPQWLYYIPHTCYMNKKAIVWIVKKNDENLDALSIYHAVLDEVDPTKPVVPTEYRQENIAKNDITNYVRQCIDTSEITMDMIEDIVAFYHNPENMDYDDS